MVVRVTFRSEVYIEAENLAEAEKKWCEMELFSEEANQNSACQIEVNSVEDGETFEDLLEEWNKL